MVTKKFGNSLAMKVPQLNMVVMLKEDLIISTGFQEANRRSYGKI